MRGILLHYGGGTPAKRAIGHPTFYFIMDGGKAPKGLDYYKGLRKVYSSFISGDELLPVPSVMEAFTRRTISLLMTVIKMQKFIAVNREILEEALKVLAHRSNAMWDILLAAEEVAKSLTGSVLTTKTLRFQMAYMDTWKTLINLYGVPMYIT